MKGKLSRRELIKQASLAAAGFSIVPRRVLGGRGYVAPSEQLTKAVIGTGGMGMGHLHMSASKLVAVCDADANHLRNALNRARDQGDKGVKGYRDFREVLERADVDIVHIATPPHWHGLMVIAAAEAGKDIWSEKPMTRTIGEGVKAVEAVQRHGRIFRINTRFRYEADIPDCGVRCWTMRKIVKNGLLGWPLKVNIAVANGFPWKLDMWKGRTDLVPEPVPEALDYNMWLGPAPVKPYHPHRVHMSFRGYWDYDGGGLGDQGQHFLDPVQCFLGKDDTSPVYVEAEGPFQHPDAAGPWRRVHMRYADGCEINLLGTDEQKDPPFVEGPLGKIYAGFRCTNPNIEKQLKETPDPDPIQTDFLQCVRTREKFVLNEANAHRSCTLVNLAKIAVRLLRPLHYDPARQEFVGDPEANRLINEPMREPWRV